MHAVRRFSLAFVCSLPVAATATNYTWTGLGATSSWTDSDNWNPGGFPGAGGGNFDNALFPAQSQNYQLNLPNSPVGIASITVQAPYSFGPGLGVFSLSQGIVGTDALVHVGSTAVVVFRSAASAGSAQINTHSGGSLQFLGSSSAATASLSGAGSVTFADSSQAGSAQISSSGSLRFSNNASAANATIIASGDLRFSNTSTAGNAMLNVTGALYFSDAALGGNASVQLNNGVLDTQGMTGPLSLYHVEDSIAQSGLLRLGAASVRLSSNADAQIHGTISGTGSLAKAGSGRLELYGNSSYSGTVTVQDGSLKVEGSLASASLGVQAGAALSGGGTVGNVSLAGILIPGSENSPALTLNSLACSAGEVDVTLAISASMTITQPLLQSACPQLVFKLYGGAPSGTTFVLANLPGGTDYADANVVIEPPVGFTFLHSVGSSAIEVTLFTPGDLIFIDDFD